MKLGVFRRLEALYGRMQRAYDQVAGAIDFTCMGCPRNCCTGYFQHHTYVEWAYMDKGVKALPKAERDEIVARAQAYVDRAGTMLALGERPDVMCPLNVDGLCGLYSHRLMICRLHGVPHTLQGRSGDAGEYPGCFRFQEEAEGRADVPLLNRTPLYRELAALEMDFLGAKIKRLPRVDLTIAEMLVQDLQSLVL
ncbi:MAG: hypothetical protein SVS15_08670 [Thermodesulfobacteriota bacterium]|nr:hypothetical protein [Thermodesulfobacteriota bacterium]